MPQFGAFDIAAVLFHEISDVVATAPIARLTFNRDRGFWNVCEGEEVWGIIHLPNHELAVVTAAIRGVVEGDRYPHAPRLDPLRAALARLDAVTEPKTPSQAKADTRGQR
jgi:hypothetical protein